MLAVVAAVMLAACAPQLARHGSIARGTGADAPLSLCQRLAHVAAAALRYPDSMSAHRAASICGAARSL